MAGPPSAAYSRLTCFYVGTGVPFGAVTTHGFTTPTSPFASVVTAIQSFGDLLVAPCATNVTLSTIEWKVGPEESGSTEIITVNQAGTQASDPLPPNVATLVRLSPAGVSNRYGGRFFLPPAGEGSTNSGGSIIPATLTIMQGQVTDAYNAMLAVGAEPRIFRADGGPPRIVDQIQVQGRFASQRQRLRR